ncbi:conserved hypothetical protein, partial [Ricinus communis]
TGAMRLPILAIVLYCVLIFASIRSDAVPKKAFFFSNDGNKRKNTSSNEPIEAVNGYFCNKGTKNSNKTSDEKRVVPTGPNPLHNR